MEKSEYEIQHFGFSVEQVSLERRHFLNKMLSLALQAMVDKLPVNKPTTTDALIQQKEVVKSAIMDAFEPQLQRAEALDRKNFSIPDHVLLSDYDQIKQYTEADELRIDEEFAALKQTFLENSVMIAMLKAENDKYESIKPRVEEEITVQTQVQESLNQTETQWTKLCELVQETKSLIRKSQAGSHQEEALHH